MIPTFPLSEMLFSCKRFLHVSAMPTLTYNWVSSVIIKNAPILNFIHNIINPRGDRFGLFRNWSVLSSFHTSLRVFSKQMKHITKDTLFCRHSIHRR